jgi:hypothetical protein
MRLPVSLQLRELLLALAFGAGAGVLYDLLRPLRRGRLSTGLTDAAYCLLLFFGLLGFALYVGRGRLRLFAVGASGLSGGLWLTLSAALRKSLRKAAKKPKIFCRKIKKSVAISQ